MISETTKLILPVLSNNLNIVHLKNPNLESNVLERHPVETKTSDGHPVECPQNILVNDLKKV